MNPFGYGPYGPVFTDEEKRQIAPLIDKAIAVGNTSQWYMAGDFPTMTSGLSFLFQQGVDTITATCALIDARETASAALQRLILQLRPTRLKGNGEPYKVPNYASTAPEADQIPCSYGMASFRNRRVHWEALLISPQESLQKLIAAEAN